MPDDVCDQDELDHRLLDYYGGAFDENDRLVGRSDQGVLEFERTHGPELRAAAMLLAQRFSDVPGICDLSQHLLGIGRRG